MRDDRAIQKANETYQKCSRAMEPSTAVAALTMFLALPFLIVEAAIVIARRAVGP